MKGVWPFQNRQLDRSPSMPPSGVVSLKLGDGNLTE
jgi:hypothetical protein